MHRTGTIAPESADAAREVYESLEPAARTVVEEVAREMAGDRATFEAHVTESVITTARNALFASLLAVRVGTRAEFETWRDGFDGEVVTAGSETVSGVVWHAPPVADRAVAATFETEEDAAVATLRRQAFGRLYRSLL